MKTTITSFIILLVSFGQISAQEETIFGSGSVSLTGVWGGASNALVSFDGDYNFSEGGYFVFEFNDDYLFGWSGYGGEVNLENDQDVKINGNDFLFGYTHQSAKSIHPVAYLKAGVADLEISGFKDDRIGIIEPSVGVEANITRWFRLGLEGGYRFVTNVETEGYTDGDFSSPIVGIRLKFGWSWD